MAVPGFSPCPDTVVAAQDVPHHHAQMTRAGRPPANPCACPLRNAFVGLARQKSRPNAQLANHASTHPSPIEFHKNHHVKGK